MSGATSAIGYRAELVVLNQNLFEVDEYEIDGSRFVYGGDERANLIETSGDAISAYRGIRAMYQFFPSVVGAQLILDNDSHERGFILEGDRLTYTIEGETVRVYRRLQE